MSADELAIPMPEQMETMREEEDMVEMRSFSEKSLLLDTSTTSEDTHRPCDTTTANNTEQSFPRNSNYSNSNIVGLQVVSTKISRHGASTADQF